MSPQRTKNSNDLQKTPSTWFKSFCKPRTVSNDNKKASFVNITYITY